MSTSRSLDRVPSVEARRLYPSPSAASIDAASVHDAAAEDDPSEMGLAASERVVAVAKTMARFDGVLDAEPDVEPEATQAWAAGELVEAGSIRASPTQSLSSSPPVAVPRKLDLRRPSDPPARHKAPGGDRT